MKLLTDLLETKQDKTGHFELPFAFASKRVFVQNLSYKKCSVNWFMVVLYNNQINARALIGQSAVV